MYLMEEFIQQKFIDGQDGQKFHFADKIIMNLIDLKSTFLIVPELRSHLKVVIREAFGVNVQIKLCRSKLDGTLDCFLTGTQVGSTEILFYDAMEQDEKYQIVLDYSHSILAFHKFDTCPHLPIEVSMISVSEAEMINTTRKNKPGITDKSSRDKLKDLFSRLSMTAKLTLDDPYNEGSFMLSSHSEKEFEVLHSQDFSVDLKMGIYIEVFYSPFDDEVMELYLGERYDRFELQADSGDAEYDNDDKKNKKAFILNKYKTAKQVWVDLEPGDYTLQIVNKRQVQKSSTSLFENVNF